jgi:hypothetical protein
MRQAREGVSIQASWRMNDWTRCCSFASERPSVNERILLLMRRVVGGCPCTLSCIGDTREVLRIPGRIGLLAVGSWRWTVVKKKWCGVLFMFEWLCTVYMCRKNTWTQHPWIHVLNPLNRRDACLGEGWLMTLYHCKTRCVVVVMFPAPLRCPTRAEGSVWHCARLMATANTFPRLQEARAPQCAAFHTQTGDGTAKK